jgi:hypothetical protein
MDERTQKLRRAVQRYRREIDRARRIHADASQEFSEAIRAAYNDGMKKADILRGIDHKWSRTWVDKAIRGDRPDAEQ